MTQALDLAFNAAVQTMARKVWRNGYDVSNDPCYAAQDDHLAYFDQISEDRRVTIYTGGSEHTIFGEPEINWDFRAWHEWTHYILRQPFTLDGELAVAHRQCEDLARVYGHEARTARWQQLIMAEVYGQALYYKRNGRFPIAQSMFDQTYLLDPEAAFSVC